MQIDWNTFWSGVVGTTLPAFVVSVILLILNHRTSKALEKHRTGLAEKLSVLESELEKRTAMFSAWHQKRLDALIEIYEAFRAYLDFLRRALYLPEQRVSLDPMWEFRATLDRNIVFLDDQLQRQVLTYQGEVLYFWNWAFEQHRTGDAGVKAVQHRLDYEIPQYLEKLRKVVNTYADLGYAKEGVPGDKA